MRFESYYKYIEDPQNVFAATVRIENCKVVDIKFEYRTISHPTKFVKYVKAIYEDIAKRSTRLANVTLEHYFSYNGPDVPEVSYGLLY